jgi:hypothetical protein
LESNHHGNRSTEKVGEVDHGRHKQSPRKRRNGGTPLGMEISDGAILFVVKSLVLKWSINLISNPNPRLQSSKIVIIYTTIVTSATVIMKRRPVFRDITPFCRLKVKRRFG